MRYLTFTEILELHRRVIERWGGAAEIRDAGLLNSAVAQPQMTFGGQELYPTIAAKAAALGYLLICNHPLVDGNKRVGYAAMETMLVMNGFEIEASVDDAERTTIRVASGAAAREEFLQWIMAHLKPR